MKWKNPKVSILLQSETKFSTLIRICLQIFSFSVATAKNMDSQSRQIAMDIIC